MFAASKTAKAASAAAATDPKFNYVTMLLHGDGTNGAQNNTFLDSSTNNFTITRNGNTTQGTFTPYGSNWSNYLDGVGDRLSSPASTAIDLSTADFTIECWVYPTSFSATPAIVVYQNNDASNTNYGYWLIIKTTGVVRFENFSGSSQVGFDASPAISLNTWTHIAVTRTGTSATTYINGVGTTGTVSATFNSPTGAILNIGDGYGPSFGSANPYSGYISNLRIVKGTRVYTANFTPPTAPLTAITNTSLLTCQSNRFIDNSTNNFTITKNGDTSVQRFSPFSPTTAYSTSVIGGSGYFDGSGDYLDAGAQTAYALGTGDFTVECWIYATAASDSPIYEGRANGSSSDGFTLTAFSSSVIRIYSGSALISSSGTSYLNQWTHVAVCRSSAITTLYINGVSVGTSVLLGNNATGSAVVGGGRYGGTTSVTSYFTGYISNFRIVKGTAVYTSAFTPPSAPLTAITNTSLLLSYTNAGILDNAMMNDLETVGNAQISTSVKKYGTGSIAFDGAGDYLISKASPIWLFSGDWTMEAWIYPTNVTGVHVIFETRNRTTNASPCLYTSGTNLVVDTGTAAVVSAGTITINTWQHVAATRSGNSWRIFINGTQVGSTTTNTTAYTTAYGCCIGSSFYNEDYAGYIDDARITQGYARYTANFTPPTAAFPNN